MLFLALIGCGIFLTSRFFIYLNLNYFYSNFNIFVKFIIQCLQRIIISRANKKKTLQNKMQIYIIMNIE